MQIPCGPNEPFNGLNTAVDALSGLLLRAFIGGDWTLPGLVKLRPVTPLANIPGGDAPCSNSSEVSDQSSTSGSPFVKFCEERETLVLNQ